MPISPLNQILTELEIKYKFTHFITLTIPPDARVNLYNNATLIKNVIRAFIKKIRNKFDHYIYTVELTTTSQTPHIHLIIAANTENSLFIDVKELQLT